MVNQPTRTRSASLLSSPSSPRKSASMAGSCRPPRVSSSAHDGPSDSEHFDPTYGLRPEGLPHKSVFSTFRSLFSPNKGLAELAEEESDIDEADRSFDSGNWDDLGPDSSFSIASPSEAGDVEEYESVPAIGGGTITRPRVIHAHSQLISPDESVSGRSRATPRPPRSSLSGITRSTSTASVMERSQSWTGHYHPYFIGATPLYANPGGYFEGDERHSFERSRYNSEYPLTSSPPPSSVLSLADPSSRLTSPCSSRTRNSLSSDITQSIATPPNPPSENGEGIQINRIRRASFSSSLDRFGSPPDHLAISDHDPKIVLKPNLSSVSRLSMLSNSNHTLSPYTRTLEHFTVRSVPPRETTSSGSGSAAERQPVKARRKRTFYLGKKPLSNSELMTPAVLSRPMSPEPPSSDFDASDMDRYFRARDDLVAPYSDIHPNPTHARRRSRYTNDNST